MAKRIPQRQKDQLHVVLRRVRQDAGFTQAALAKGMGQQQPFVSKIESGERRIDVLELRQLCEVLGVRLVDFIDELERALRGK